MTTPLLGNILNQAESLRVVADYHFGPGREALERAADVLRSKKQKVLSGMGASCFACIPFESPLKARCVETGELLYFPPLTFGLDTAVVIVSRSGESIEVIKLLDKLQSIGVPVLAIVNAPGSTLDKRANLSVNIHSPTDQLVAIQTYTATLTVFALLHAAVEGVLSQAKADLENTIEILGELLPEWVDLRQGWRTFLEGNAPLYLLGRGSTLGAVLEGVLLMHETAKAPAVGMSVPQFRHGPVEVVDDDFRVLIIGTQSETAQLDLALANDIVSMGGQARWLGPHTPTCKADSLCRWPANPPARFQAVLETVPLQIVAYTKSELRGFRPGDFRWTSAITTSESGFVI